MKVEVNVRWLAVFVSLLIMVALRNHRVWLIVYSICALSITASWALVWPRISRAAYDRLYLLSLRAKSQEDLNQLDLRLSQSKWLRFTPYAYGLYEIYGLLAHRRQRYSEAIQAWKRALESAPIEFHERIHINVARSYLQIEDFDAAIDTFQYVLSLDPYSVLAKDGLADAQRQQKTKSPSVEMSLKGGPS